MFHILSLGNETNVSSFPGIKLFINNILEVRVDFGKMCRTRVWI